jgi:hypothetical protein
MKKILFTIILLTALCAALFSVTGTAGGAAPFLRTGAGARALSLSGAFTAYYDDATCPYWNPASIGLFKQAALSSMFSWLTQDRSYGFFNAVMPSEYGGFAVNVINYSIGNIEHHTSSDTAYDYLFSDSENAYFLTYGRNLFNNIYLGISLKYIRDSLDTFGASGLSGDLGTLIKFSDIVSFGLVFQDLFGNLQWTNGTNEKIPLLMRMGTLVRFLDGGVKWSFDAEDNEFEGVAFKTGVEGVIIKIISLRAGVSYGASSGEFNYTFGGGLKYAFGGFVFQLDYCFLTQASEINHIMSLDVYFNI